MSPTPVHLSASETRPGTAGAAPRLRFVLLTAALAYMTCLAVVVSSVNFQELMAQRFDNPKYLACADALRELRPAAVLENREKFLGLPVLIAGVGSALRTTNATAMIVVSVLAGLAGVVLCWRMYGPWVAVAFSVVSFSWIGLLVLGGGAEALFMALLLGALLAARRQRFGWAGFLAGLTVTVRPHGVFVVAAVVTSSASRRYRDVLRPALAASVVVGIYALVLHLFSSSLLAHWQGYSTDWYGRWPVTLPVLPVISGLLSETGSAATIAYRAAWIIAVSAAVAVMLARRSYGVLLEHRGEAWYAAMATAFLYSYNSPVAAEQFPRFAILVLPFFLAALEDYLPKSRAVWIAAAAVSGVLTGISLVGVATVGARLR